MSSPAAATLPPDSPSSRRRPVRRALLVGINQYPHLPPDKQLHGCVLDVQAMAHALEERFDFADLTVLTDERATRAGIVAAMQRLLDETGPGDTVVFHYSGHGSRAPSLDRNEADGLDETILPHDTAHDGTAPNLDIHDKQIRSWLVHLTERTDNVVLIFDSCHSGGITRDIEGGAARFMAPDRRPPRLLPVPWTDTTAGEPPLGVDGPSGWLPVDRRCVLLAGCRSEEFSYELVSGREHHGALTYFLCRHLATARQDTTYRDLFQATAVEVTGNCTLQHPQLEGDGDRRLFGLDQFPAMRFVGVTARQIGAPGAAEVMLGAGAAMNVTVGSQWAVYPGGTKQVDAATPRLGTIEVVTAAGVTSTAKVVDEARRDAIAAGARAVEVKHAFGGLALAVKVAPAARGEDDGAALAAALNKSCIVRLAASDETPAATVHLLPARCSAAATDPVPQVPRLAEPTWAVVGQLGELILPLAAQARNGPDWVLKSLERLTRHRVALALQNPGSPLAGAVRCALLRKAAGGRWQTARPSPGGMPVYVEGDSLGFELYNTSPMPLFVYVLDLGVSGRISLIYPPPGGDKQLPARRKIRVGIKAGEGLGLALPRNFPFDPGDRAAVDGGQETLKIVATRQPADFTSIVQDAPSAKGAIYRAEARGPLDQLLGMMGGEPVRDVTVQTSFAADEWAVTDLSFRLRAKGAAAPD